MDNFPFPIEYKYREHHLQVVLRLRHAPKDGQLQRSPLQLRPHPQGDIAGIVDSAEGLVVEHKYDAWGKPVLVRTLTGRKLESLSS